MHGVVLERLGCNLVKRLHIDEAVYESLLVHLHHVGCDAAQGKACFHTLVDHALAYVFHRCQRCAARACLYRKSVFEITAVDDNLGCLFCQEYVARILGVAYRSRGNLRRVAHRGHFYHIVDVVLRYRIWSVGVGYKVVGEYYHLVGIVCIGQGVAQRATYRLCFLRPRVAAGIAQRVARRGAQEGHVDVQVAVHDCTAATAV